MGRVQVDLWWISSKGSGRGCSREDLYDHMDSSMVLGSTFLCIYTINGTLQMFLLHNSLKAHNQVEEINLDPFASTFAIQTLIFPINGILQGLENKLTNMQRKRKVNAISSNGCRTISMYTWWLNSQKTTATVPAGTGNQGNNILVGYSGYKCVGTEQIRHMKWKNPEDCRWLEEQQQQQQETSGTRKL